VVDNLALVETQKMPIGLDNAHDFPLYKDFLPFPKYFDVSPCPGTPPKCDDQDATLDYLED
jgi:hypothetical protein